MCDIPGPGAFPSLPLSEGLCLTFPVDFDLHGDLPGHAKEVALQRLLHQPLLLLRHPRHLLLRGLSRLQPVPQLLQGGCPGRHGGLLATQGHGHGDAARHGHGQRHAVTCAERAGSARGIQSPSPTSQCTSTEGLSCGNPAG